MNDIKFFRASLSLKGDSYEPNKPPFGSTAGKVTHYC